MVDLLSAFPSLKNTLSSFFSSAAGGLGQRLTSGLSPTPFEKALQELVAIHQERLELNQQEFKARMASDRENRMASFLRQEKDIEAANKRLEKHFSLSQWPLEELPHEIIPELASFGGKAINLIVCANRNDISYAPRESGGHSPNPSGSKVLQHQYIRTIDDLTYWVSSRYPFDASSHLVVPYIRAEKRDLSALSMGRKLRAELRSEPTIFIHLDVRSANRIPVLVEMWGLAGSGRSVTGELEPLVFQDTPILNLASVDDLILKGQVLDFSLKALVAGLIDLAHLAWHINRPDLRRPVAPRILLAEHPALIKQEPKMLAIYDQTIDQIARVEPFIAIHTSLDLASQLLAQGNTALSQHYFAVARDSLLSGLSKQSSGLEWHDTGSLPRLGNGAIGQALVRLRDIRSQYSDLPAEASKISTETPHHEQLAELSRTLGPSTKE